MGYKLTGFNVLGGVEIDPEMMGIYRKNFAPRHSYLMPIQEFKEWRWSSELMDLDVLDGSPPCSSFSMAGNREKDWGKKKVFREGQADQVLDDLFFHFVELAKRMRPKVVIAENVKGLVIGNARGYVKQIFDAFREAQYDCQLFLLNSSRMGVPQARERTFFIARRRDLALPKISINFNERPISCRSAFLGVTDSREARQLTPLFKGYWNRILPGRGLSDINKYNQWKKIHPDLPGFTQTSSIRLMHWESARLLSDQEVIRIQSFPDDYDFCGVNPGYVCGMSVPPLMMQRVADQVLRQWLRPATSVSP